jgi:hypothetical protein
LSNNLATVAAQLEAGLLAALERAADGELEERIAEAQAERGEQLLAMMFDTATAPSGAPWLPPARDYGHPLLRASGDLEASGECEVGPRLDATGHELTFRFTDEKAPWQHFGTKRGGRQPSGLRRKSGADGSPARMHIPPRPLLPEQATAGAWIADLDQVGQRAADAWLTANVRT